MENFFIFYKWVGCPPFQESGMKKFAFLGLTTLLLVILDGFLAHDIFDQDFLTPKGWLILLIAIVLFAIIILADSTSKNTPDKTSEGKIPPGNEA